MSETNVTDRDKQAVIVRAKGCCEYCRSQVSYSPDPFAVEHINPHARGGKSVLDNVALSCQGCNNLKYTHIEALDPITGESAPLFHPRRHVWREHFTWSEDYALLVGRTPTGRATIVRLQLNREGVVNLRGVLLMRGVHPPEDVER